jgi:hypothetical protein
MDLDKIDSLLLICGIEVGKHFYWEFQGITFHGQVLLLVYL